jgi:Pentapeptide repeats (8 copies)
MSQMTRDGTARRLLGALADDSPAFRARTYPAAGNFVRRLLVALADASPAFARHGLDDSYSSRPAVGGDPQPGVLRLAVAPPSPAVQPEGYQASRIAAAIAPAFGDYARAEAFAASTSNGLALALVLARPVALSMIEDVARDLAVHVADDLGLARKLEASLADDSSRASLARSNARYWAAKYRHYLINAEPTRMKNPADLGISELLNDALVLLQHNSRYIAAKAEGVPEFALDHFYASSAAMDLMLAAGYASYLADTVGHREICARSRDLADEVERDLYTAATLANALARDLRGANLRQVNLTGADLDGVTWSTSTLWPANLLPKIRRRSIRIGLDEFRIEHHEGGHEPPAKDMTGTG